VGQGTKGSIITTRAAARQPVGHCQMEGIMDNIKQYGNVTKTKRKKPALQKNKHNQNFTENRLLISLPPRCPAMLHHLPPFNPTPPCPSITIATQNVGGMRGEFQLKKGPKLSMIRKLITPAFIVDL
jgi:hypothetical protein